MGKTPLLVAALGHPRAAPQGADCSHLRGVALGAPRWVGPERLAANAADHPVAAVELFHFPSPLRPEATEPLLPDAFPTVPDGLVLVQEAPFGGQRSPLRLQPTVRPRRLAPGFPAAELLALGAPPAVSRAPHPMRRSARCSGNRELGAPSRIGTCSGRTESNQSHHSPRRCRPSLSAGALSTPP